MRKREREKVKSAREKKKIIKREREIEKEAESIKRKEKRVTALVIFSSINSIFMKFLRSKK